MFLNINNSKVKCYLSLNYRCFQMDSMNSSESKNFVNISKS